MEALITHVYRADEAAADALDAREVLGEDWGAPWKGAVSQRV